METLRPLQNESHYSPPRFIGFPQKSLKFFMNTFTFIHNIKDADMDTDFFGRPVRSTTLAIENLSAEVLNNLLTSPNKVTKVQVGVAYVHPKDKYVKQIGREVSIQKCKYIEIQLARVSFYVDYTSFTFYVTDEQRKTMTDKIVPYEYRFVLRLGKTTSRYTRRN